MIGTTVFKKNKNMVTRKIADETILLPIYRTSKEINCIYTLNKPASIVWDMIDGKTTIGEIKDKVLNNGFDLIKDSAYRIKDKVERGKDEGLRIKDKEERGKQREREREREREEKLQSRDRACPVLKIQKQEVDSQLKVFFKELKEIKAIVKSKELRAKGIEQREKAQSGKSKDKKQSTQKKSVVSNNSVIPACRQAGVVAKKGRKMKFRPEITRVKLNPEQAVLTCTCYLGHGHANTTEWSGAYPLGEIPRYCQGKELVHSFTGGVSNSPYRFVWVSGINGAGSS